jgi:hypothetical protein
LKSIGFCFFVLGGFCTNIAWAAPQQLMPCDNIEILRAQKLVGDTLDFHKRLEPVPVPNPANCDIGVRIDTETTTVWRCRVNIPETAVDGDWQWQQAIMIVSSQSPILYYRSELMANEYDRFEIIKADLDRDGNRENILATWDSLGNGMGVHTWTVRVFSANWQLISPAYEVKDWGPSAIIKSQKSNRCEIAITSWVEDSSRRNIGIAFEARFVSLVNGALRPSTDMPILRRRFTNNFQNQRNETFETPGGNFEGDPAKWLSQASYVYLGR